MSLPAPARAQHGPTFRGLGGFQVTLAPSLWLLAVVWIAGAGDVLRGLAGFLGLVLAIYVHELGHAWAAWRVALDPRIVLYAGGGWCVHRRTDDLREQVRVSLAGPGLGLAVGVPAYVVGVGAGVLAPGAVPGIPAIAMAGLAPVVLWGFVLGSVFVNALNLLPVLPLDGGAIVANRLRAWTSWTSVPVIVHVLGVLVAGVVVRLALTADWPGVAVMFAALGVWNLVKLFQPEPETPAGGTRRSATPRGPVPVPEGATGRATSASAGPKPPGAGPRVIPGVRMMPDGTFQVLRPEDQAPPED